MWNSYNLKVEIDVFEKTSVMNDLMKFRSFSMNFYNEIFYRHVFKDKDNEEIDPEAFKVVWNILDVDPSKN